MDSSEISENRLVRQQELVPAAQLVGMLATIVGVGAIGRQVALQLAAIGVPSLQLVDFDRVDTSNITTQGYTQEEIGLLKVEAMARAIGQLDSTIQVSHIADRYRASLDIGEAVFCCVDSIEARAVIWRSAGKRAHFWADGRMLGEASRILVAAGEVGREHYPTTLFPAREAAVGRCTARSTIYTANIAAGLMVHQFARWVRGQPTDSDLSLNLLASELVIQ